MPRGARVRPKRLARKLLEIRTALDLSQSEMLRLLGLDQTMDYRRISEFERGTTEPYLTIVLQYARVAQVHMEDIVDDGLDLPPSLPGKVIYKGISHSLRKKR